jgi:hypothetical protein
MPGPTTTTLLEAAFVPVLEAMQPRTEMQREGGAWKHVEGERPAGTNLRCFRFEWDPLGFTPGGFMGRQGAAGPRSWVDTSVTLTIFVDYGGIAAHLVKHVVEDDFYQVRDVLNRLKATVDGFRWLETDDWDFVNTDPNQRQAALQYLVRYMKERG